VVATFTEPLADGGHASLTSAPVLAVLELLIGGNATNHSLHVLLQQGYDETAQRQLAPCATEEGSSIDVLIAGGRCSLGLSAGQQQQQQEAAANSKPSKGKTTFCMTAAVEDGQEVAPENGNDGGDAEVFEGVQHCSAGLLTVARNGSPGLVLTLGPQACLDASHRGMGPVL